MSENSTCKTCGKEAITLASGEKVHNGGGSATQICRSCGWTGGQYGGFSSCPRCGDATNLHIDHITA